MDSNSTLMHDVDLRNRAVEHIEALPARAGVRMSRDEDVVASRDLMTDLIPADFAGVTRTFLPVAPIMPTDSAARFSAYGTRMTPGAVLTTRRLSGANFALKVVLSGAIECGGTRLTRGDWLWIPAGEEYGYTALETGAHLFTVLPALDQDGRDVTLEEILAGMQAAGEAKAAATGDFLTSLDHEAPRDVSGISVVNEEAAGLTHSLLPFAPQMPVPQPPVLDGRFFAWISDLEPGTEVPRHSHELEGIADIKVVIDGSITCEAGRTLRSGDWLWAPAGGSYAFTAGPEGATLLGGWPHN